MEKFYSENGKKNLIIILVTFLILIAGTISYVFFIDNNLENGYDKTLTELENINYGVEEGPLDDGNKKSDKKGSEEDFIFTINKKITLKNSESLANLKIENPETNKYNFYVEIKLNDDVIYKSPILEPNQHIQRDYLNNKLKKGIYEVVATIFVIDPETEEIVAQNDNNIEIKINK